MNFKQDFYIPKHPEKYVGDVHRIFYRSSWELEFNKFLDNNPYVIGWSSEPVAIPYIKPTDNKVHRYFPDYWVKYRNASGDIIEEIIEVKPKSQTRRSRRRNPKHKLYEDIQFAINTAKWQYAQKWCEERGIKFKIVTEIGIFR